MGRDKRLDAYVRSREKVRLEELLREEIGHDQRIDHDPLPRLMALDGDEQRHRTTAGASPDGGS